MAWQASTPDQNDVKDYEGAFNMPNLLTVQQHPQLHQKCAMKFEYIKSEPANSDETPHQSAIGQMQTKAGSQTVGFHVNNEWTTGDPSEDKNTRHSPENVFSSTNTSPVEPTYELSVRLEAIEKLYKGNPLAAKLLKIEAVLGDELMKLDYGEKVSHAYNPVDYAYKPHLEYYRKYCRSSAKVVMIGMNPGPYGMSQTGVPFGQVNAVSEWMNISESVGSPTKVHAKRPVWGFDCKYSEVSGSRIWSFLRSNFKSPDDFFSQCFIYNYCPLAFMRASGKNITPAELPAHIKRQLIALCDEALLKSVQLFPQCESLVGVGRFAEQRIQAVCKLGSLTHKQYYLLHPSPQNPHANKHWTPTARKRFEELGILPPTPEDTTVASPVKPPEAVKRKLFDPDSGQ